jgi:hypothetical protein
MEEADERAESRLSFCQMGGASGTMEWVSLSLEISHENWWWLLANASEQGGLAWLKEHHPGKNMQPRGMFQLHEATPGTARSYK